MSITFKENRIYISCIKLTDIMEYIIFKIFIFCMFIILGVLIFGLIQWIFRNAKLCYQHIEWKIKILIIIPISALIIPWLLFQTLISKGYTELIIAIIIGSIGSYYIFEKEEKNEI